MQSSLGSEWAESASKCDLVDAEIEDRLSPAMSRVGAVAGAPLDSAHRAAIDRQCDNAWAISGSTPVATLWACGYQLGGENIGYAFISFTLLNHVDALGKKWNLRI